MSHGPKGRKKGREKTGSTPVFNIGVVSQLTGLPIYTLRWLERNGLVEPCRSNGNQRVFSEDELGLLRKIRALMDENVNLPGIRMILQMRQEWVVTGSGGKRKR